MKQNAIAGLGVMKVQMMKLKKPAKSPMSEPRPGPSKIPVKMCIRDSYTAWLNSLFTDTDELAALIAAMPDAQQAIAAGKVDELIASGKDVYKRQADI